MTIPTFIAAVLALLLTPGPTNTLLAVGGASAGFRRSLPLILAEVSGYLLTITPLVTFAGPYLVAHPLAASAIKLCSAAWVLLLAIRLWTTPPATAGTSPSLVTFRQVFITTVLNPKALIFGLVLIPHGTLTTVLPWLGLFVIMVISAACIWLIAGAAIIYRRRNGQFPPLLARIAASAMLLFAASLAGSSLGLI
ncbi:LysE family translocator [Pararhizobium sp. O133]|uniref:LysE family translocator n=1 Tax=Pararhizobium sp. O133 TaxID=3449278 RepID=UPI003F688090